IPLLFVVSALAAIAFVAVERRVRDPVLQLDFFRIGTFTGATAVGFATSFGLFAVFFFSALYLQVVANFSGWRIALEFLAMTLAMVVAGRVAGIWIAARGSRGPMASGCLLAGLAIFGVARLLEPHPSFARLAAVPALLDFGHGLPLVA